MEEGTDLESPFFLVTTLSVHFYFSHFPYFLLKVLYFLLHPLRGSLERRGVHSVKLLIFMYGCVLLWLSAFSKLLVFLHSPSLLRVSCKSILRELNVALKAACISHRWTMSSEIWNQLSCLKAVWLRIGTHVEESIYFVRTQVYININHFLVLPLIFIMSILQMRKVRTREVEKLSQSHTYLMGCLRGLKKWYSKVLGLINVHWQYRDNGYIHAHYMIRRDVENEKKKFRHIT